MNQLLAHRGPDGEGAFLDGPLGLAHRRLKVIDLVSGDQPMSDPSGRYTLVFNGEIYNYQELKLELASGWEFQTTSDTEVLLAALIRWGTGALARLNGMFAFALWDREARTLLLARDRFGKKPLYYAQAENNFAFASEPKALLSLPFVHRAIDPQALAAFLSYEYLPGERSIWAGIKRLPRASYLLVKPEGGLAAERYWTLQPERGLPDDFAARRDRFRDLFTQAVRRRLYADVPLGVFLSGGLDSSAVVAAMSGLAGASRIKTFSIGFARRDFDERRHARAVARHFGTEHYEAEFSPGTLLDLLPQVAARMDEPLADPSLLPVYLLAQFARREVTVALAGDGGDELLAGYSTHRAELLAAAARSVPRGLRKRLEKAAAAWPVSHREGRLAYRFARLLRDLDEPRDVRHAAWLSAFRPDELPELLAPEWRRQVSVEQVFAPHREAWREMAEAGDLERMLHQYLAVYLTDDLMVKVDRASMAFGLEVRAPFLDHELVSFAMGLPFRDRMRWGISKYILRRAFARELPSQILWRGKKGFAVPIGEWLLQPLRALADDLLAPDRLKRQGIFDAGQVARLRREHEERRADHRKRLWALLTFQLWAEHWRPEL